MLSDKINEDYSTDWLDTPFRSLSSVDSALRCQVCKDFYTTPMITSCSHTFCSLCIRRCLSNDGRCPACRTQEQELKLRNNGAIEELVEAFKGARTEILEYVRKQRPISTCNSPLKRKLEDGNSKDDATSPSKRTRFSKRLINSAQDIVVSDSGSREENIPVCLVRCPICNFQMHHSQVNAHLDRNCHEEPSGTTISTFDKTTHKGIKISRNTAVEPQRRPERLPKLNFSMFKDVQLRKKLGEYGLSQGGSRQAMQKRCSEWITLWNSNCDAKLPRPSRELRGELERWERIQEGRLPGINPANSCIKIKEKDFDGKAWSDCHFESFKELTEKARLKVEKSQPKRVFPEIISESQEPFPSLSKLQHPEVLQADFKVNSNSLLQQSSPPSQGRLFEENSSDVPSDLLNGSNKIVRA